METIMVDGPISYSCWLYTNPEGRPTIIHNFGDIHHLTSGCSGKQEANGFVSIEKLISETMHYSNGLAMVDFFLEGIRHDCYKNHHGFFDDLSHLGALNRLESEFSPCLCLTSEQKRRECRQSFPSGRIHASDIRRILGFPGFININDDIIFRNWPEIEDKQSDTWITFRNLVKNQIYRVKDASVRKDLLEMFKKIKALSQVEFQKVFYAPLMDIYLLGRLFRSYKPEYEYDLKNFFLTSMFEYNLNDFFLTSNFNLTKSDFNNAPVQNAVIYSGYKHKRVYDNFFNKIGTRAELLYSFSSPNINDEVGPAQCVQIPAFVRHPWHRPCLPIVSDFQNNETIKSAYKEFNRNLRTPLKELLYNNYAIQKEERKVIMRFPFQRLLQKKRQKYPKKPQEEEPPAKRQRT